jgi:hypothetical protein
MNEIPNAIRTTGDEDPHDRVVHEIAVGVRGAVVVREPSA